MNLRSVNNRFKYVKNNFDTRKSKDVIKVVNNQNKPKIRNKIKILGFY